MGEELTFWAKLRDLFKSRYVAILERRVSELTAERDAAIVREQDAYATLLAHIGAPLVQRHPGKVELVPPSGGMRLPSQWRAEREHEARERAAKKTKQEA